MGERYNVSKVLSVFTAREIAKLSAVTSGKVNINSANPGKQLMLLQKDHTIDQFTGLCESGFRDDMGRILAAEFLVRYRRRHDAR
jgi:hypothetical protein